MIITKVRNDVQLEINRSLTVTVAVVEQGLVQLLSHCYVAQSLDVAEEASSSNSRSTKLFYVINSVSKLEFRQGIVRIAAIPVLLCKRLNQIMGD
jgi:hypothetical protein